MLEIDEKMIRVITAYHEAGHVVAKFALDLTFSKVVIFDDGRGVVVPEDSNEEQFDFDATFWFFFSQNFPNEPIPKAARENMRKLTISLLCGPEAERRIRVQFGDLEESDHVWLMFCFDYEFLRPDRHDDVFKILENAWFLHRKTYRRRDPVEVFPRFQPGRKTVWNFYKSLNESNRKFLQEMELDARAIVDVWWDRIVVLAGSLLERSVLTYEECQVLVFPRILNNQARRRR